MAQWAWVFTLKGVLQQSEQDIGLACHPADSSSNNEDFPHPDKEYLNSNIPLPPQCLNFRLFHRVLILWWIDSLFRSTQETFHIPSNNTPDKGRLIHSSVSHRSDYWRKKWQYNLPFPSEKMTQEHFEANLGSLHLFCPKEAAENERTLQGMSDLLK